MQTSDIDIAQDRGVSLALDDATPPPLETLGALDASFRAIPSPHDSRRSTSYHGAHGVRVDFLVPNTGPESDAPQMLPALATDAQPLRFLDYLIREPVRAVLLHDIGVPVTVPAPERFAVHKLIVSQRRKSGSEKSRKDLAQAEALLDALSTHRPADLNAAWSEAWSGGQTGGGRRWRALLGQALGHVSPGVRDRALAVVGQTRSVVPGLDLTFSAPPVRHDFDRYVLTFWGESGGRRQRCAVSAEALEDHFGATGVDKASLLAAFREHRGTIERLLRAKHLYAPPIDANETLLRTDDVLALGARR